MQHIEESFINSGKTLIFSNLLNSLQNNSEEVISRSIENSQQPGLASKSLLSVYKSKNDFNLYTKMLNKHLANFPNDIEAWKDLAQLYSENGNFE